MKTQHGLQRLRYIDGLRAVGALWVALGHYMPSPGRLVDERFIPLWQGIFTRYGDAVLMFLVLSGFCLAYPLALKNPGRTLSQVSYRAFMARRARRILPPYYGALLVCLLGIFLLPVMRGLNPDPLSGPAILSHLFLVHNLIEGHQHAIDYPAWSIGLEWQLYLLFPTLAWMLWKFGAPVTLSATAVLALGVRVLGKMSPGDWSHALRSGPLAYAFIFVLGMYAAQLTASYHTSISGSRAIPRWTLWAAFIVSTFVSVRAIGGTPGEELGCGVATFFLLLLAADSKSFMQRGLSTRWLDGLGVFSYSIYLLHAPILYLMMRLVPQDRVSVELRFGFFLLIAVPVMTALSYGFFLIFEKPFLRTHRAIPVSHVPAAMPSELSAQPKTPN